MPNWLTDPLWKGPSRAASSMADWIDPREGEGGRLRGFLAGATQGAGDVLSDMTSPLSIASTALGGSGLKRLAGLRSIVPSKLGGSAARLMEVASPYTGDLAEAYEHLGPEFVPIGGEDIINALRKIRSAGAGTGPISGSRYPIGGGFDPAELISRIRR